MKKLLLSGIILISSLLTSQNSDAKLDSNGCTSMGEPYVIISVTTAPTDTILDSLGWYDVYTTTNTYSNCFPSGLPVLINSTTVVTMGGP